MGVESSFANCRQGRRDCHGRIRQRHGLAMTEEESVFAREHGDRSKLGFDVLGGVLRRVSSPPQIVLGTGKGFQDSKVV